MNDDNIFQKLERNNKPRVHIKYEVETEDGIQEKELPFVIGVMGNFSGNKPSSSKKPLKERKFITVDKDNLDSVMAQLHPELALSIKNELSDDNETLKVTLTFSTMEDFEPDNIVRQVPLLNELYQIRTHLSELLAKADNSEHIEQLLNDMMEQQPQLIPLLKQIESH